MDPHILRDIHPRTELVPELLGVGHSVDKGQDLLVSVLRKKQFVQLFAREKSVVQLLDLLNVAIDVERQNLRVVYEDLVVGILDVEELFTLSQLDWLEPRFAHYAWPSFIQLPKGLLVLLIDLQKVQEHLGVKIE